MGSLLEAIPEAARGVELGMRHVMQTGSVYFGVGWGATVIFRIFCFLLFLLPFSKTFEFELSSVTFSLYTVGLLVMLPIALWREILMRRPYGFRPVDVAIVILGLTFFQSTLLSDDMRQSGFLAFHALFIPIVSYVVVKSMIHTERQYRGALSAVQAGLFLFAIATVVMYLKQGQRPFVFNIPPIGVATLFCMAIVQLLFGYTYWNGLRVIALLAACLALVVTFSRVYLLLTCLSFVVVRLTRSRWVVPMWLTAFVFTLILTIMATVMINPGVLPREAKANVNTWERITDSESYTRALSIRVYNYRLALAGFLKNPLFGSGMQKGEGGMITPHNFHVEWLAYGGMIGYVVYAAVFLLHVVAVRREVRTDRWLAANLATLFIVLMNSLTNGFMHGIMPSVAFVVMGLNEARLNLLRTKNS